MNGEEFFDAKREADEDARAEFRVRKRWGGCYNQMCGATDCPNCYPGSYDWEDEEEL